MLSSRNNMKTVLVFFVFSLRELYANGASAGMQYGSAKMNRSGDYPVLFGKEKGFSWYTEMPLLPVLFANSDTLPDGLCKEQAKLYLRELDNFTLWAVEMFDSSVKYPDGILEGNRMHLGNFDGCYNIHTTVANHDKMEAIDGRYCLIEFSFERTEVIPRDDLPLEVHFDPNLSAWERIQHRGDFRRTRRDKPHIALCVPASCKAEDVEAALTEPLGKLAASHGLKLRTIVLPERCSTRKEERQFSTADIVFCCVVLAIFTVVFASSWYDSNFYPTVHGKVQEGNSQLEKFILCFSIRRNYTSITDQRPLHQGLDCIHLIRLYLTFMSITGHRWLQYLDYPVVSSRVHEQILSEPAFLFMSNGAVIVDGFIALSGLLLTYTLLSDLDKTKKINFTSLIVVRFLRLTPLYMLVVFFHATLLPKIGAGPFWETRVGFEYENCVSNWWTNLLYINNYVNTENMCMFQTWQLSVDFHSYIVGLVVVYLIWRRPKLGYAVLAGLGFLGFLIPFTITYMRDLQPIIFGSADISDPRFDSFYLNFYIKTHNRLGTYMIGVVTGVLIYKHKNSTWKLSKTVSRLLLLAVVGLYSASILLGYPFFNPNSKPSSLHKATYSVMHRIGYAWSICSLVLLMSVGDGLGFINTLLTPNWAPPFARLTYGVYLTHNILQMYSLGFTRIPRTQSLYYGHTEVASDMVFSFLMSLILSLTVEGPIRKIEKVLLTKREKKVHQSGNGQANGTYKTE